MKRVLVAFGCAYASTAGADEALSLLQTSAKINPLDKPQRVAIVGAGTSGHAAVVHLKKNYGSRFNVTLFEKNAKVGGVVTSTQYGKSTDWNEGMVDSGMVVSSRFAYPNMFAFMDSEGIKTVKRPMKQFVYDSPEFYDNPTKYEKDFREFYEHLLAFDGNFEEFIDAHQDSVNPTEKWFMATNNNLKHGHFAFMTLDMGSMTNHVAGAMTMLNITGNSQYEAPIGGYYKYSQKAASYADRTITDATVTAVEMATEDDKTALLAGKPFVSGSASVSYKSGGEEKTEEFDAVILCVGAPDIKKLFPKFDLPTDGWEQTVTVHKKHHGDSPAFFNMHEVGTHNSHGDIYPNGNDGPYVTFWGDSCDDDCRREQIPKEDVYAEYPHQTWVQGNRESRGLIQKFLKSVNGGKGGLHFAGVWTTDGRFAEGAWVSGMRAAMEVAGDDPSTYEFSSECSKRSFDRYGLWYNQKDTKDMKLSAIPPACFTETGDVPSYFKSLEEYEKFYDSITKGSAEPVLLLDTVPRERSPPFASPVRAPPYPF